MSVLVIGLSHRTAPLELLEAAATTDAAALARRVVAGEGVAEAVVLSTCNRLEVYAEVVTFHGAVATIGEALAHASGAAIGDLSRHLYVHYEDRAVAHAFTVACGLDSMALGEAQVLGQLRSALRTAQGSGTAGPSLNSLVQQALRVGKRAHAETAIDQVSLSLVEAGLDAAVERVGALGRADVLVVGAGGMSSLAATTVARHAAGTLTVVNRTAAKAQRLATSLDAQARPFGELPDALAAADVVVTSTGSLGHLLTRDLVAAATAGRTERPLVLLDLALPRDVEPAVADLPGVTVVDLDGLGRRMAGASTSSLPQVQAVTDLVTAEVASYLTGRMAQSVVPTVAALRSRAHGVMDAELSRLDQRLPDLDDQTRAEVHRGVHRIVEKLLHTPTVRIKELTSNGHGGDYAAALRELFDLDPHDVASVSAPPTVPVPAPEPAAAAPDGGGER
ncbi:glutamyl-tRNA reductase [Lapillicoccus jejuensis]|uniref:Glutamyl-tRNA reductase n=1 Tax=Lapillicoccus jejuensis TaxID=402171 RepID=A0A542DX79_9MICO|nr:glutamyl-tRNA reductase [Lapillicoccus jejuensis]TQJ07692.1 glutamyl-tRNA reductase [Lapillicoccus jejuensis]